MLCTEVPKPWRKAGIEYRVPNTNTNTILPVTYHDFSYLKKYITVVILNKN